MKVDVLFQDETVWLTQEQMAQLFGKGRTTITEHIGNIFKEGELKEEKVCRKFRHTTQHGAIEGLLQTQEVKYYNLDVIISVGYRVKSRQGTMFRIWATRPSGTGTCSKEVFELIHKKMIETLGIFDN